MENGSTTHQKELGINLQKKGANKMRKRYIALIILGIILTEMAHKIATAQRGYDAIGGEIFMLPLLLFMGLAVDEGKVMIDEIKEIFEEGDDEKWEQKERASSTTRC